MRDQELPGLTLRDGRWAEVYELNFGKGRLCLAERRGALWYVDEW